MTGLFGYFTNENTPIEFPGAPFLTGAILTFISLIFAVYILRGKEPKNDVMIYCSIKKVEKHP